MTAEATPTRKGRIGVRIGKLAAVTAEDGPITDGAAEVGVGLDLSGTGKVPGGLIAQFVAEIDLHLVCVGELVVVHHLAEVGVQIFDSRHHGGSHDFRRANTDEIFIEVCAAGFIFCVEGFRFGHISFIKG